MTYEDFQAYVNAIIDKLKDDKPEVSFSHSDGRHYARFSDGTTIIGNSVAKRVMVRWGAGHAAHATI